ncbi:MAG TPA: GspH/FimT family pseudopilin [Vicinamibacterales bacterium]|jgi:Tfp pilus assembly protein FimT
MFVAATVAIMAAAAVPQLTAGVERTRAASAARYLAGRLAFARALAVARSANVAMLLTAGEGTFTSALYVDGNGNGVRTHEIGAGIDPLVAPPVRLADVFPHVVLSLSDPSGTPASETSALLSFTPVGTASSRTLYVRGRDGSQYAVRVLGATGRTRVLRYAPATRTWIEVL